MFGPRPQSYVGPSLSLSLPTRRPYTSPSDDLVVPGEGRGDPSRVFPPPPHTVTPVVGRQGLLLCDGWEWKGRMDGRSEGFSGVRVGVTVVLFPVSFYPSTLVTGSVVPNPSGRKRIPSTHFYRSSIFFSLMLKVSSIVNDTRPYLL